MTSTRAYILAVGFLDSLTEEVGNVFHYDSRVLTFRVLNLSRENIILRIYRTECYH